jgi:hypothetical protein
LRWILLVTGLVITGAGLAIGLPDLLSGDHDKYGRVDAPGKGRVELPEGEVVVFNEVARSFSDNEAFSEPDIKWSIRPVDGGRPLELDGDGGRETNVRDDRSWTDFEGLDVPAEDTYQVDIRSIQADGPEPVVTFGTSGVTTEALVAVIAGAGVGTTLIALAFVIPAAGRRAEP